MLYSFEELLDFFENIPERTLRGCMKKLCITPKRNKIEGVGYTEEQFKKLERYIKDNRRPPYMKRVIDIAELYEVSTTTINHYIKSLGIPTELKCYYEDYCDDGKTHCFTYIDSQYLKRLCEYADYRKEENQKKYAKANAKAEEMDEHKAELKAVFVPRYFTSERFERFYNAGDFPSFEEITPLCFQDAAKTEGAEA